MTTYCAPGYCQELGRNCVDVRAEIERLQTALHFGYDPKWQEEIERLRELEANLSAALADQAAEMEQLQKGGWALGYNAGKEVYHAEIIAMLAEIERLKAALRAVMPIAEAFKGRADMEPQLQVGRDALEEGTQLPAQEAWGKRRPGE